jgi:F0F1-type ATP synthase membrane subunit c/vacuolar-type H+-ATPase subunit K
MTNRTTVLTVILASMLMACLLYIGITYAVPVEPKPEPRLLIQILGIAAAAGFLLGLALEQALLTRAKTAAQVQSAAIVSGAMGEAIAIYGLVVYFLSGKREWVFFIGGLLYLMALMLRIPRFILAMDEKERNP